MRLLLRRAHINERPVVVAALVDHIQRLLPVDLAVHRNWLRHNCVVSRSHASEQLGALDPAPNVDGNAKRVCGRLHLDGAQPDAGCLYSSEVGHNVGLSAEDLLAEEFVLHK